MYAVIKTGGKQYRVQPGDVIDIERPKVALDRGSEVVFDRVLLVGGDGEARIGGPLIDGARVDGVCLAEVRGPKIKVFKMKRRKGYRRHRGHRQDLLRVRIGDIHAGGDGESPEAVSADQTSEAVSADPTPEAVSADPTSEVVSADPTPEVVSAEAVSADETPEAVSADQTPEAVSADETPDDDTSTPAKE